jgi:hypothetical protein
MDTTSKKSDLSVVLIEVDRLSKDVDLFLTDEEIKEYEEIKRLGEILLEMTQSSKSIYYTGT